MSQTRLEVVTWGETMLRLSPPVGQSLESAQALELSVGGTESNLAIALARLGRRVGWVSRLPENPLGRRIAREVAGHGVDVSHVLWTPDDRAGLIFIETAHPPRSNRVLYDRAHSALARLDAADLDYAYLASAETLFLTGVTPALSEGCRAAWLRSAAAAKAAGRRVVVDVNHRATLWSAERARETLEAVFPHADIVISALGDLQTLFGMPRDAELAARTFREAYRLPLVVLTLGAEGALACDGAVQRHPVFRTDVLDRIGAGDAFAAGFLHGERERGVAWGLRCGCALAALKQTYRGDVTWSRAEDLRDLVEGAEVDPRRVLR